MNSQSGNRLLWILLLLLLATVATAALVQTKSSDGKTNQGINMGYNKLTPEEEHVIVNMGTEAPFSGEYNKLDEDGSYLCKRCNASLYGSADKFESSCGWPAFDDAIDGAVTQKPDADGRRTEILCSNCGGHLGHIFSGERLTDKNVRHCVNSISLQFVAASESSEAASESSEAASESSEAASESSEAATKSSEATSESSEATGEAAFFAGGCFWGTEYLLQQQEGVISAKVGYMGGTTDNPTYKEVCSGNTGHTETVEVIFDPNKTSYEKLARFFFEIHDPTQVNRQGPDVGDQYRSAIFVNSDEQRETAQKLIDILKGKGYNVVTEVVDGGTFWEGEGYHQDYYEGNGKQPYCHSYQKRF